MIDSKGNGYWIPKAKGAFEYSCKMRKLPYHSFWSPNNPEKHNTIVANEGRTELALIDHGKAPQNAGYEYCILMRADEADMQSFAASMADPAKAFYRVIQKDNRAHIVNDAASKTTGYVLFEAGTVNHSTVLRQTSRPCLVMTRELPQGVLHLSVCDPDIGSEPQEPAPPTTVTLTLAGEWNLNKNFKAASAAYNKGSTEITVTCRDIIPVKMRLSPYKTSPEEVAESMK